MRTRNVVPHSRHHRLKITQQVRAFALEQSGRRCECTGGNCRHHRRAARCKHGLRGDEWKVYWRTEAGGATRDNIEAWCHQCFDNNFEVPRETVALFSPDIIGYGRMMEEDRRRAITLKSILRDATERAAAEHGGRMVLDRLEDDVLVELAGAREAIQAARSSCSAFREIAGRLDLEVPDLHGAIHCGEVIRWRNGFLAGDAVEVTSRVREVAGLGEILVTGPAVEPLKGSVELEPLGDRGGEEVPPVGEMWVLRL